VRADNETLDAENCSCFEGNNAQKFMNMRIWVPSQMCIFPCELKVSFKLRLYNSKFFMAHTTIPEIDWLLLYGCCRCHTYLAATKFAVNVLFIKVHRVGTINKSMFWTVSVTLILMKLPSASSFRLRHHCNNKLFLCIICRKCTCTCMLYAS
jgi:hypothetical protein